MTYRLTAPKEGGRLTSFGSDPHICLTFDQCTVKSLDLSVTGRVVASGARLKNAKFIAYCNGAPPGQVVELSYC